MFLLPLSQESLPSRKSNVPPDLPVRVDTSLTESLTPKKASHPQAKSITVCLEGRKHTLVTSVPTP